MVEDGRRRSKLVTVVVWGGLWLQLLPPASAQQVADTSFRPSVTAPAFPAGRGPVVLLDEAHFNFHTTTGRYLPFVRLIERDGFVVRANRARFSRSALAGARILVIANALADTGAWVLPARSAFTPEEVRAVREWVRGGGSLLLIADHMPFPGGAHSLGEAFGVRFTNGFAMDSAARGGTAVFRRSDGSLAHHPVTDGIGTGERIDSIRSFTGQAFQLSGPGTPLLTLDSTFVNFLPDTAWQFHAGTRRHPARGMLQGAAIGFGRGKVAVFGEAAMFSAQVSGPSRQPMGMNRPDAPQNAQFALNVMRWLADDRSKTVEGGRR